MRSKLHLPVLMLSICCVAIAGGLVARKAASAPAAKDSAAPRQEVRLERRTPEYWRVTFDNPPFNIFGPETIPQLNAVITQIEKDPRVRVVVFDSAVPGFFLTHYDFIPPFVDALARRIARFDKQAIADIKRMVDVASLPSDAEIGAGWAAFITSVQRPEAQKQVTQLMGLGLQKNADVEKRLADYTGKLEAVK
jgi:hypothetical protein